MGGKFDKSFNEAAYNGAERFKKETGVAYREFEVANAAQREQAIAQLARRGARLACAMRDQNRHQEADIHAQGRSMADTDPEMAGRQADLLHLPCCV